VKRAASINPAHVHAPTIYRVTPLPLPGRDGHRPRRHGAYLRQVLGTGEHPDGELHCTWFAGGGGSTEGAEAAGVSIDYALNHDAIALRLHEVNHPAAVTWCADAFAASPLELEPGRPIGSMWFSPDCTHHSKARGAAPKSARIRGLAWCVLPWAKIRRPRVIFIENVEEFQDWCPLDEHGHAIKGRKGETFRLFNKRMAQAGYVGEWRELVTADYSDEQLAPLGGQTTRKRLFGIFRCDGEPIVWPERTHAPKGRARKLDLKPYCPAASFLDFAQPCPSIFLTQAEAKAQGLRVKRPLVKATLRRIVKGLDRFVISSAQPFLVHLTHHGADRVHSIGDPLATVTAANRGEIALVQPQARSAPYMIGCGGRRGQSPPIGVDRPAPTMTGKADTWLISPTLLRTDMQSAKFSGVYGPEEPIRTVTSGGGLATASAFLVPRYGEREGQEPRALPIDQPYPTVVPDGNGGGLATAFLGRQFGSNVSGRSIEEPLGTVMSEGAGGKSSLIAANLITYYGTAVGSDAAEPLRTVTGEDRHGLVSTFLEQANTGMVGHSVEGPTSTICGKAANQRFVEARLQAIGAEPGSRREQVLQLLWSEFGEPTDAEWADPVGTLDARRKFGLVVLGSEVFEIADIGLRMLTVRELYRAQTFPPDYVIDRDVKGRPITTTQATLMCGNAVPPLMAKLLYQGNVAPSASAQAREAA
jgi:DNA (cytosine-5)-methyltransferase 1